MCEDIQKILRYGNHIKTLDNENEHGAFRLKLIYYEGIMYTIIAHNGCFCIMDAI